MKCKHTSFLVVLLSTGSIYASHLREESTRLVSSVNDNNAHLMSNQLRNKFKLAIESEMTLQMRKIQPRVGEKIKIVINLDKTIETSDVKALVCDAVGRDIADLNRQFELAKQEYNSLMQHYAQRYEDLAYWQDVPLSEFADILRRARKAAKEGEALMGKVRRLKTMLYQEVYEFAQDQIGEIAIKHRLGEVRNESDGEVLYPIRCCGCIW